MTPASLDAAYAHCAALAYQHYENFPVASWLLPRQMRPHIAAVYAFARTADDFADSPDRTPDERLRLLNEWRAKLHRTLRGEREDDPVFIALGASIRRCDLPVQLFEDLLSAFRQDVTVHRYDTWDEVLDYCRRSANPVGRLVLRIAGVHSEDACRSSDALCTALQLANFWQDLGPDWHNGRLYVPREEADGAGASEKDLGGQRLNPEWRAAVRACVVTTRALFEAGRPVADAVHGRLRLELRATWLGGSRILDKIERLDCDTMATRPVLHLTDGLRMLPSLLMWNNRRRT
jgi:squalene synthase HpnC